MRLQILKALLWLVCITHISLGLAGLASPGYAIQMARLFYGATLDATPVVVHILRIVGAYMFTVGILGGVAARDPQRHRAFILTVAALLGIRVLQRLFHVGEIEATFGVSSTRLY